MPPHSPLSLLYMPAPLLYLVLINTQASDRKEREERGNMARAIRIQSRLRKKKKKKQLHILPGLAQALKGSRSLKVPRDTIILGYLLYICNLKLRLEAARREYWRLMALKKQYLSLLENANMKPKVEVKKAGRGYYEVKVTSERKEDMLVSTLEAFEIVGLDVLRARVSSGHFFSMDAFAVARDQRDMDAHVVAQAILKALENKNDKMERRPE